MTTTVHLFDGEYQTGEKTPKYCKKPCESSSTTSFPDGTTVLFRENREVLGVPVNQEAAMFKMIKRLFSRAQRDAQLQERLERLRQKIPVPVLWLYGKTQSGKTTLIKYLTGAEQAEIGQGFRPCTRYSMEYHFPTAEAPLLTFLDTRGVDEPGYDPGEDLARFDELAHVVLVTAKVLDHAQQNVLDHLRRFARPGQIGPSSSFSLACTRPTPISNILSRIHLPRDL